MTTRSLLLFAVLLPVALRAGTSPSSVEEKADQAMKTILKPVSLTTNAIIRASEEADVRLRAVEFFDLKLPMEKSQELFHLSFEPKIGDLLRRDYLRLPVDVSYTPATNLTLTVGLTPFTPNPFRKSSGFGFGKVSNEVRYDAHPKRLFFESIIVGAGCDIPLGKVPVDLINGYTHIKPFVALSKNLAGEKFKLIIEASHDIATKWVHSADEYYKFNVVQYGPALLYKPREFGYLIQYSLKHYDRSVDGFTGHLARAGLLWDLPRKRTENWGLPGKWEVNVALESETNEFGKTGLGVNTRVRWKFDLKKKKS